jgi:diadenosine tetraphosphate (Ap4A) HIT family hydrolase
MEAGQDYRGAPNVIAINIVNYEFMPEAPGFHLSFHICGKRQGSAAGGHTTGETRGKTGNRFQNEKAWNTH